MSIFDRVFGGITAKATEAAIMVDTTDPTVAATVMGCHPQAGTSAGSVAELPGLECRWRTVLSALWDVVDSHAVHRMWCIGAAGKQVLRSMRESDCLILRSLKPRSQG